MNELMSLRDFAQGNPSAFLRLQLLLVLAASLVLPLMGLLMSYLREWMRHAHRPH